MDFNINELDIQSYEGSFMTDKYLLRRLKPTDLNIFNYSFVKNGKPWSPRLGPTSFCAADNKPHIRLTNIR